DLANPVLEFLILALALGVAHLLHDHLLRRLCGDAPKVHRGQRFGDEVARLRGGILLARVCERDLVGRVLDRLADLHQALQIDLGPNAGFGAVARPRRLLDGVFHRRHHDHAVDRLFARDGIRDLQQLEPVCADSHSSYPPLDALAPSCSFCRARCLSLRSASRTSSSLSVSLASPMSAKGSETSVASPVWPGTAMRRRSPSRPAMTPLKRLRPSMLRAISTFAVWPNACSKSERRT